MSNLIEVIASIRSAGGSITVDGGEIKVSAPPGTLSPDDRSALAKNRETLISILPSVDPERESIQGGEIVDGDQIEVTGEIAIAAATPSPWWWSGELSRQDNQVLDDFMAYDPELGPAGEVEQIVLTEGCERCGSILGWVDVQGVEHCLGHEKPSLRSYARQAATLRENAAQRLADPSVPMYGRARPYRGRKQRARFAGAAK